MTILGSVLALGFFLFSTVVLGQASSDQPSTASPAKSTETLNVQNNTRRYFAVTLRTSPVPLSTRKVAAEFPDRLIYLSRTSIKGKELFIVRAGFFTTSAEATAFRNRILKSYPDAAVTSVTDTEFRAVPGSEKFMSATSPKINAATPSVPASGMAAAAPMTTTSATASESDVDSQAALFMGQGREALIKGDNNLAIRNFNQLLKLPPNRFTQDAQEFIGLARERSGDTAKAKTEYELYLRLYPKGEGADRVRQRLANVGAAPIAAVELKEPKKKETSERYIYGSLSQYYYHGSSQIDTTTTTGTTVDKATLSATDQSALVTNVDVTERFRSQSYDNRLVFRDTYTKNFLTGQDDINRVNAAYAEIKHRPADISARVGRQPGTSGGVLGRFDGALFGYGLAPQWRLNAVAGIPVEIGVESKKHFFGMSADMGTFAEHWGASVYVIHQVVDDIPDRQAVGGDVRYFDPKRSFYSLIDYDVLFNELNTILFQGTWQSATNTTYNLLLDHRLAPALQTSNALIGQPVPTIKELRTTLTEEQIRNQAKALTPTSDLAMIGASHPFNSKWQLGGDVRLSKISGTEAAGTQPAVEGTGNTYIYTLQAIGTNIVTKRDITVFSLSHIDSKTFNGQSFSASNRSILRDRWTLEPSIRYYRQEDNLQTRLTRLTPTLKLGYKWKESITLDIEGGLEKSETRGTTQQEDTTRKFYSIGYRWDF